MKQYIIRTTYVCGNYKEQENKGQHSGEWLLLRVGEQDYLRDEEHWENFKGVKNVIDI